MLCFGVLQPELISSLRLNVLPLGKFRCAVFLCQFVIGVDQCEMVPLGQPLRTVHLEAVMTDMEHRAVLDGLLYRGVAGFILKQLPQVVFIRVAALLQLQRLAVNAFGLNF